MTGNVVISEVDVLVNVVLSEAEKHVPYGQLNVKRYRRGVTQTEVVVTRLNCILFTKVIAFCSH